MRHGMRSRINRLAAFGLLAVAGCSRGSDEAERLPSGLPCPRSEPVEFEVGAVIRIADVEPPCRIEWREAEVVLRGHPDAAHPDPGRMIVMDSRGRFFTANASGYPSIISIWDADGSYLSSFGAGGDGPGEFSTRGALSIFMDAHDRLHVRDGGPRWSVFDSNQSFLRTVPATQMGGISSTSIVLDDGSAVNGSAYGSASPGTGPSFYFKVVDSTGVSFEQIAPINPAFLEGVRAGFDRALAYGGGASFWAGPPIYYPGYSPEGYAVEEWGVDGTLLRRIERDVPWLKANWPPPPPGPETGTMPERPSQVTLVNIDTEGVLLVGILSQAEDWRPLTVAEYSALPEEERRRQYVLRLELIDTRTGELLASEVLAPEDLPSGGIISGTRRLFNSDLGADMVPEVRFVEYDLVTR